MGITKNHIYTENQIALAQLFKALAHPARVAIVENLMTHDNLNCTDLGQFIELAQSTISKHIKELHEVGILDVKVVGSNAYYQVNEFALEQISDYLEEIYRMLERNQIDKLFSYTKPYQRVQFPYFRIQNSA